MLKKFVIIGALAALTGCATHQQANTAVGAGTGAVIGHAIGGHGGAVAGAVVGSMIGSQQPTQPPVYVTPPPVYTYPPYDHRASCEIYKQRERNCYSYRYSDTRAMCIEDARNRHFHCMVR